MSQDRGRRQRLHTMNHASWTAGAHPFDTHSSPPRSMNRRSIKYYSQRRPNTRQTSRPIIPSSRTGFAAMTCTTCRQWSCGLYKYGPYGNCQEQRPWHQPANWNQPPRAKANDLVRRGPVQQCSWIGGDSAEIVPQRCLFAFCRIRRRPVHCEYVKWHLPFQQRCRCSQHEHPNVFSQRRDAVFTEANEDMPPRSRTIDSSMKQQSRRETCAAPVAKLPPEQNLGEEPRRAESAIAYGIAR